MSKAEFLTLKLILALALLAPFALASTASASSTSISVSLDPVQSSFTAGSAGSLSASASDSNGWQHLKRIFLLISTSPSHKADSVFMLYNPAHNILALRNDTNTSWSACVPGSSRTLSNSQVSVNCAASSVSGSGDTLTVKPSLTFTGVLGGKTLGVYMRAVDKNGTAVVWHQVGTATISAANSPAPAPAPAPSTAPMYDWVSYYGSGSLSQLEKFHLVDIDVEDGAGNYTAADVAKLKAGGSIVVSYLNIGAAETFRSYWNQAQAYILKAYEGWPDEYWMDASNPGWRNLIVNTVAPQLIAKGVDGFYLDNIDLVDEYPNRPDIRAGIVELVRELRAKYPGKLIIAQNGLTVYGDTGSDGKKFYQYLNASANEEVNSTYEGGYHALPTADSDAIVQELEGWKAKGLTIYTLDYAITDSLASYDYTRSQNDGFHPYVADKELDKVYLWSFAPMTTTYSLTLSAMGAFTSMPAAEPEVVPTYASANWASYSDYASRLLTVDITLVNVGQGPAASTRLEAYQSQPTTRLASIPGALPAMASGASGNMELKLAIPAGVNSFLLTPEISYSDSGGSVNYSSEMD